jgi:DTW domain-containing protein
VEPQPTRTRVIVLCHPREADNPIGTARIARLCLPNSELVVGVELEAHPSVQAALGDTARLPIVLYPSERAVDLAATPPPGPVTLFVVDGTWGHARSMVRHNPWLDGLPHYAFRPARPSEYRIRREPQEDYVSTVEALAEALRHLEADGRDFEALRAPFRAMVAMQVAYAERSSGGRKRVRRRPAAGEAPSRLPAELLAPSVVCLSGEANAYPHVAHVPVHPHELVQLVLARVATEDGAIRAVHELFARPRAPLATSPLVHGRLSREVLESAPPIAELVARAADVMRADDVVCTWGHYAASLFRAGGGVLPARVIDLRKVVGDVTREKPGSLEDTVARLGLSHAPSGVGRAGERTGMLVAVVRYLCAELHEAQKRRPART